MSSLLSEVSFRTGVPDESSGNPARDLATSFANALRGAGWQTSEPEDIEYAFALRSRVEDADFYLLVGYVGDGVREWLISVNSDVGWLRRLMGRNDDAAMRTLTGEIDRILRSTGEISDVRWYTLKNWNNDPDNRWSEHPVA